MGMVLLRPSIDLLSHTLRGLICEGRELPSSSSSSLTIHTYMNKCGLQSHISLGNYLVSMLIEARDLPSAQNVFDSLLCKRVSSWNSLIYGYVKCGHFHQAISLYEKMQEENLHPNKYAFSALLRACAQLRDVLSGCKLHAQVTGRGLLESDAVIGTSLVDMYAKYGMLKKAQDIFDHIWTRDVVAWTALISGYADHECNVKAIMCYQHMKLEGLCPNDFTFSCILKACDTLNLCRTNRNPSKLIIETGIEIHCELARIGALNRSLVVATSLVDMYTKWGALWKAREVFDCLPLRNVVSWTSLMSGYVEQDRGKEALVLYEQMQGTDVSPTATTYACLLRACASIGDLNKGKSFHSEIVEKKWLEENVFLGSDLVNMYMQCGSLFEAEEVFHILQTHDVVSWGMLISGYVEHEHEHNAFNCLDLMRIEGISPDAAIFTCVLKACGNAQDFKKGLTIYAEVARRGMLHEDRCLGNALVYMYVHCGFVKMAREVFDLLPLQNEATWTILMEGYLRLGMGEEAVDCFEKMQWEGLTPDSVTLNCISKAKARTIPKRFAKI